MKPKILRPGCELRDDPRRRAHGRVPGQNLPPERFSVQRVHSRADIPSGHGSDALPRAA